MRHGVPIRRQRRTRVWRTVLPTFLIAVAVFGTTVALPWLLHGVSQGDVAPAEAVQGKQRSLLLLIHDAENELTAAVAVGTDTAAMAVTAIGYPAQTEVRCAATLSTLAAAYGEVGVAAADRLSEATGEHYDAVLRFSVGAVASLVASLGNGIRYSLPETVGTLSAGEQTLTSLQVADVLRYTDWQRDVTGRAEVHAGVVAAIVNRYLTPGFNLEELFCAFAAQCEDSVSIAGFTLVREELERLAAVNDGTLCRIVVPAGFTVGTAAARRFVIAAA